MKLSKYQKPQIIKKTNLKPLFDWFNYTNKKNKNIPIDNHLIYINGEKQTFKKGKTKYQKYNILPIIPPKAKIIISTPNSLDNLKTGNFVCINIKNKKLVHRIVYTDENTIITKGDANTLPDKPIQKSKIISKVNSYNFKKNKIHINHIYLAISTLYSYEIAKIAKQLKQAHIKHIFIKSLPTHFFITNSYPKRLYADQDIIINNKSDLPKAQKILNKLGFQIKNSNPKSKQIALVKQTDIIPLKIDLHLEPSISFVKIPSLAKLTPTNKIKQIMFENTISVTFNDQKFTILNPEANLFFLLLHLFHHNFQGYHRLEIIQTLLKKHSINWGKFNHITKKSTYNGIIYTSLSVVDKIYHTNYIQFLNVRISTLTKIKMKIITILPLSYFLSTYDKPVARPIRFIFSTTLSPLNTKNKLNIVLCPKTILHTLINYYTDLFQKEHKFF